MEHIRVLFILALCFFFHFYFLYPCTCEVTNKKTFSDEYKLLVYSCIVLFSYCYDFIHTE